MLENNSKEPVSPEQILNQPFPNYSSPSCIPNRRGGVYTGTCGAYDEGIKHILFVANEMKQETRLPVGKASVFE